MALVRLHLTETNADAALAIAGIFHSCIGYWTCQTTRSCILQVHNKVDLVKAIRDGNTSLQHLHLEVYEQEGIDGVQAWLH